MENKKELIIRVIFCFTIAILLTTMALRKPNNMVSSPIKTCKEDSLRNVVGQLQSDLEIEEDGWDKKERRYEDILFEYEFGLNRLKEYHPEAYKDFHRIIAYKENYSHETERENKKRLNINKW